MTKILNSKPSESIFLSLIAAFPRPEEDAEFGLKSSINIEDQAEKENEELSLISSQDEAILEILFSRPVGPLKSSLEDFINVRMSNLDMHEIQDREPTIVEYVEDRPSLDWNRLKDCNDDYDEILVTPYGRL